MSLSHYLKTGDEIKIKSKEEEEENMKTILYFIYEGAENLLALIEFLCLLQRRAQKKNQIANLSSNREHFELVYLELNSSELHKSNFRSHSF